LRFGLFQHHQLYFLLQIALVEPVLPLFGDVMLTTPVVLFLVPLPTENAILWASKDLADSFYAEMSLPMLLHPTVAREVSTKHFLFFYICCSIF
jgi:hypothetical protein